MSDPDETPPEPETGEELAEDAAEIEEVGEPFDGNFA
jgi:hypothetical protein